MWDLIVSVPDHCSSFYFPLPVKTERNPDTATILDKDMGCLCSSIYIYGKCD